MSCSGMETRMDASKPVSLLRLRACPCPKTRVELRVAARATWTHRANLAAIIFSIFYNLFPSQMRPKTSPSSTLTTPRLLRAPELLTPGPLHAHTRSFTCRSKSSVPSQCVQMCVHACVYQGERDPQIRVRYRSSRVQTYLLINTISCLESHERCTHNRTGQLKNPERLCY